MAAASPPTPNVGEVWSFADNAATVSDGTMSVASGVVSGEPLCDREGRVTHVPIFAERDHGREATTVFVAVENLLGKAAL